MLVLNFSHPLTEAQLAGLASMVGAVERVVDIPCQFAHDRPFAEQARALIDAVGLSQKEWQTAPLLLNLPSLAAIAATVLAEVHGRAGYFPPVLRLRPAAESMPPRFEVAEILNLQALRDEARGRR